MRPDNLLDHFMVGVREHPDRDAVIFIQHKGSKQFSYSLTYRELDVAARARAAWLQARFRPGDRVLLVYPSGLEFVRSFWGCLYAQLLPVPVPALDGAKHHLMPATGIALDAEPSVVLTDNQSLVEVSAWLRQDGLADLVYLATDTAELADPDSWVRPAGLTEDALALLWYSTRSASEPKGVMLSHGNLMHNLRLTARTLDLTEDVRFCGWLPLFHDVGLIAQLLEPLYLGGTTVLMPHTDFLERPHRWLDLIDQQDIRFSGAPDFAYELCTRRLTEEQLLGMDLSRWQHAFRSGSQVIDPEVLDRFAARFAQVGFDPSSFRVGYGMAEATLLISAGPADRAPVTEEVSVRALGHGQVDAAEPGAESKTLVSSGTVRDLDVRIVDPATATACPPGHLGEVWIRGGSVACGYWQRPQLTKETFEAVTADGEAGFLRSGDLGTLRDGELHILGRLSEVLVLHGRHLYPSDVERAVGSLHPEFARLAGSVFVVPGPQAEIVVLHEVRGPVDPQRLASLAVSVQDALGARFGVRAANVAFLRPGGIRRTTNGRVLHSLMRELFLADALDPIFECLDEEIKVQYRTADLAGTRPGRVGT